MTTLITGVVAFCRISKANDKSSSLASQEATNAKWAHDNKYTLFSTLKITGGAFNRAQPELINLLKNVNNTGIVVSEPSRLTRNFDTLCDIFRIGYKNKLSIIIVSTGDIFDMTQCIDRGRLKKLIELAHSESQAISERMIRSHKYRKENATIYGYAVNTEGKLVCHEHEQQIIWLISQMKTCNTTTFRINRSIQDISKKNKHEAFEFNNSLDSQGKPNVLSNRQICIILRHYGIYKRMNLWTEKDVSIIPTMEEQFKINTHDYSKGLMPEQIYTYCKELMTTKEQFVVESSSQKTMSKLLEMLLHRASKRAVPCVNITSTTPSEDAYYELLKSLTFESFRRKQL